MEDQIKNDPDAPQADGAPMSPATDAASAPHSVISDSRLHPAAPIADTPQLAVHADSVGFLRQLIGDVRNGVDGAAHRLEAAFGHVFGRA